MEGETCFEIFFFIFFKSVFDKFSVFFNRVSPWFAEIVLYFFWQLVFLWVAWLQLQRLVQSEYVLLIK